MKKLGLLLALSITMLTACSQVEPTEPSKPVEIEHPTVDGNTTIYQDGPIMEVAIYPGGDMSQEDFDRKTDKYTILMTGKICNNKTNKTYKMSEEDMRELLNCYEKLENGEYTETESSDCDAPYYEITISNNDDVFGSGTVKHIDEVDKIVEIIYSYD